MVEKKLNFNQPILSVRKYSVSIPTHTTDDDKKIGNVVPRFRPNRPELNSGPVRNPGAVPFQWEQTPGRPKEHIKWQTENRVDLSFGGSNSSSSSDHKMEGGDCDCDVEGESSRSICTDSQAVELMMDGYEHSEEVKKEVVNQDKPAFWYRPTFAKTCSSYNQKEESDNDHDHEKLVSIGCLLPRSCLKSSVCVLNPAPAMSVRARLMLFPSMSVQSGSSSLDSLCETENEGRVSPVVKTDEIKRVKTLQELLADEERSKELDSTTCVEKSVCIESHEDKNTSNQTQNIEKQLERAKTHGKFDEKYSIIPLPRSPSDSWLCRTLTKKVSTPTWVSGYRNKY